MRKGELYTSSILNYGLTEEHVSYMYIPVFNALADILRELFNIREPCVSNGVSLPPSFCTGASMDQD